MNRFEQNENGDGVGGDGLSDAVVREALERLGGVPHSLHELSRAIREVLEERGRAPEFREARLGGLTRAQVGRLLSGAWGLGDEASMRLDPTLTLDELAGVHLLANARTFLAALAEEGPARATSAGNLNRKFVAAMLERMDWPPGYLEDLHRYNKVVNERDAFPLHLLRVLLQLAALLRLQRGAFRITRRGLHLQTGERAGELYALLFHAQFQKMNLAYLDRAPEAPGVQQTIAYSLYRFGELGGDWRSDVELAEALLLPEMRAQIPTQEFMTWPPLIVRTRILRPLVRFGLAEEREGEPSELAVRSCSFRKSPLFDRFLRFRLDEASDAGASDGEGEERPEQSAAPRRGRRRSAAGPAPEGPACELRITLADIEPPVWRRVRLRADATLAELHVVIQAVMGWQDYHLHEFGSGALRIGDPEIDEDGDLEDERCFRIDELLREPGDRVRYDYDFGDDWRHEIELECVLDPAPAGDYPVCIAGARAAPPEDCGGVSGYEELLAAMADPRHPERAELLTWLGGPFDPEAFDLQRVNRELVDRFRSRAR